MSFTTPVDLTPTALAPTITPGIPVPTMVYSICNRYDCSLSMASTPLLVTILDHTTLICVGTVVDTALVDTALRSPRTFGNYRTVETSFRTLVMLRVVSYAIGIQLALPTGC